MSLLALKDVVMSFPGRDEPLRVVNQVSLEIEAGRCLALVGESGSGKSMTALCALRLVPRPGKIESGQIFVEGRDILGLSVPAMRKIRGSSVAMIFQEPMTSLNPVMTVGAQVVEAIRLHEKVSFIEARQRTTELFTRVRIPDPSARFDAYPHQLSGGLKQRVMIAMALAMRPKVLIADEPTTALDVTIQAQIIELLRELMSELQMGMLLITHDLGVVNELADEVAVMYAGRVVERAERVAFFKRQLHPYSMGLFRALPGRATRGERLHEISGHVPSLANLPKGCPFAPRCPHKIQVCDSAPPLRAIVDPTKVVREVACHLAPEIS